jgi:hypothetical protein
MDAAIPLVPQPRVWLRLTILLLLIAFAWIGESSWYSKAIFALATTGLFGTFPRLRISTEYFQQQWFAAFLPVYGRRMRLDKLVQIETDVETKMGMETGFALAFFVGLWDVLMIWLFDWLVPWFGGDYKLWLRTKSDRRILAWQGNGESNFRRNLDLLKDISGLPVTRG